MIIERLRALARALKSQLTVLVTAYRHPRTPWYARLWLALVLAYALSPIDLIPDFIPVLGYLDDLLLLPLGIYLGMKLIPGEIVQECRQMAAARCGGSAGALPKLGAMAIAVLWGITAFAILLLFR